MSSKPQKKKVKIKFITKTKTTTIRILRDTGEGKLIDNLRKISCQVNISHEIKNIWKPKKQESTIFKEVMVIRSQNLCLMEEETQTIEVKTMKIIKEAAQLSEFLMSTKKLTFNAISVRNISLTRLD